MYPEWPPRGRITSSRPTPRPCAPPHFRAGPRRFAFPPTAMSNPSQPDDDWAELARELERAAPPADRSAEPAPIGDERPTEDVPADFTETDETGGAYEDDEADSGETEFAGQFGPVVVGLGRV